MKGGNGHRGPLNLRALFSQSSPPPRGPFDGGDVERALISEGWTPEAAHSSDKWAVYRHPERDGRVLVNPDWEAFYEGDAIFKCLCRDMNITPDDLVRLLGPDED